MIVGRGVDIMVAIVSSRNLGRPWTPKNPTELGGQDLFYGPKNNPWKYQMAPLYTFLASSLNVELVYIILTSVNKFAFLIKDARGQLILTQDSASANR